tara:strand:- start:616 stop:1197 length:582 start_codon:yes stop_codon:yes gene_type:complete
MKTKNFIVFLLIFFPFTMVKASPIEWSVESGGNGHYYEAFSFDEGVAWETARLESERLGGYLATVSTQAENYFVFSLIDSSEFWVDDLYGPWLGGTDEGGPWRWLNDEGNFTYTSWERYQPDGCVNEDFLHYFSYDGRDATWNDMFTGEPGFADGRVKSYVVEYNMNPVPEPTTLLLLGCGILVAANVGRKKY